MPEDDAILVVNCGSSSVKFALFAGEGDQPQRLATGAIQRIGIADARFTARGVDGSVFVDETREVPNHVAALDLLLSAIDEFGLGRALGAVGHRVVHGGDGCDCPLVVTPALEARLQKLVPLAPLHLPHNLAGILAVRLRQPSLPQVACFDTAFHDRLPRLARLTGLPKRIAVEGIRRFGFHGLSYEYVIDEVRRRHGAEAARGRIVVAHLGNGASMAAISDGRSLDTTMGFSTLAGLPMGTRSGDLDPGLVLYLQLCRGLSAEELQKVLYEESGLLGLSGISRNMRDLLNRTESEPNAAETIDFFCYQARKHLAALTATLGGLDRLVFTGGIGANAPAIRARICNGLTYLGIEIDRERNQAGDGEVSPEGSRVVVEAFPTDEEWMIAHHVQRALVPKPVTRRA